MDILQLLTEDDGYYVQWDYEYVPSNCDNFVWFETEAEAREYIKIRKHIPVFVCNLIKVSNGMWEYI